MDLGLFDLLWIIVYLSAVIIIGFYNSKEKFSFKEYTTGNKGYSNSTMVATIAATLIGGNSVLGVTERIYSIGVVFLIVCLGDILSKITVAKIIAPKIAENSYATTIGDIMGKHYGISGKCITGFLGTIYSASVLAVQVGSLSYIFQYMTNIEYKYGVFLSSFVVTLYSTMGGIKAVTYTDVFQFILLITIIPIAANYAIKSIDEVQIISLIKDNKTDFDYLPLFLLFLLPSLKPSIVQRFLMSKNPEQASVTMLISALLHIPFYLFISFIAISAKHYLPGESGSTVFFKLVEVILPLGANGIVLVALLSVIMSTADSELNVASTMFVKDCIEPLKAKPLQDGTKVIVAKLLTIIIGTFATMIALTFDNLLSIIVASKYLWTPVILVPFLAAVFNLKPKKSAFIYSVIIGFVSIAVYVMLDIKYYTGFDAILPCTILNALFFLYNLNKKTKVTIFTNIFLWAVNAYPKLKKLSKKVALKLLNSFYLTKRDEINDKKNDIYATFILVSYSMPHLFWIEKASVNPVLIFQLKAIAAILSGLILAREYLPDRLKQYYQLFWFVTLCFDLVFLPFQILADTSFSKSSIIASTLSILLLSALVESSAFIIITVFGLIAGYVFAAAFFTQHTDIVDSSMIKFVLFNYIFIVAISLLFYRYRDELNRKQIEAMSIIGGAIAHEMRTPLASILVNLHLLDRLGLSKIQNITDRIRLIANKAMTSIDVMLMNLKSDLRTQSERCYMYEVIDSALKEYPLSEEERLSIHVKERSKDLEFFGDKLLIKYLLFNLIRNALHQRSIKKRGTISITIKGNILYFEDNISGMSEELLYNIFRPGVSGNNAGTGLGLSFCKVVMESIGGRIVCESEQGRFTRFKMYFPRINNVSK